MRAEAGWAPVHRIEQRSLGCFFTIMYNIQTGARKTVPPSRRSTWAHVSDSVQEIKQMQMQSTYWLQKVQKMISLYVNALLCTLQHIVIQRCQFGELTPLSCTACVTICCRVHKSALTYKEIIFCTFSNK